ncbi:MAG: DUF1801 domain-containing protein [Chloroflexi bacterium]|nr:DUF1801 domain-containing protein [Chloroflexota bacterium]
MAGIENRAGPGESTAFEEAMSASSDDVRAVARAIRELVYDVFPDSVEVVWARQRSVGWGIGPKKFTEQFAYVLPFAGHVTLGFYRGGELPDPAGLLPSEGGTQVSGALSMRSLKLGSPEDVARPELRSLIEAAVEERRSALAR